MRIGAMLRKQPEIFCLTLATRRACSAKLLVNGTASSVMKRHTSWRYSRAHRRILRRARAPGLQVTDAALGVCLMGDGLIDCGALAQRVARVALLAAVGTLT